MRRIMDIVGALLGLTLLSVPMSVIALLIRCSMGSPVLFRQQRPGLRGRPFTVLKFRTMREARGPGEGRESDEERLTSVGRFLRAFSLDELPELLNVLRGEMSLVGPRPLLMQYLDRYTPEQARRHEVRPGITGWAQIHGRNLLSWEERFALDVWYVDHRSLWLDLRILIVTLGRVVRRQGISAPGHATMPEFRGKRP